MCGDHINVKIEFKIYCEARICKQVCYQINETLEFAYGIVWSHLWILPVQIKDDEYGVLQERKKLKIDWSQDLYQRRYSSKNYNIEEMVFNVCSKLVQIIMWLGMAWEVNIARKGFLGTKQRWRPSNGLDADGPRLWWRREYLHWLLHKSSYMEVILCGGSNCYCIISGSDLNLLVELTYVLKWFKLQCKLSRSPQIRALKSILVDIGIWDRLIMRPCPLLFHSTKLWGAGAPPSLQLNYGRGGGGAPESFQSTELWGC